MIGLTSCVREDSSSVDQDKIWTSYELFYNANEDKTYARATFRFSNATGTNLELVDAAGVEVDGQSMTWKPLLAYYETTFTGFKNTVEFIYNDLDGEVFNNTVEILHDIAFPSVDSIDKSSAYDLEWIGEGLESQESVVVTINGINEGDARVFTQASIGSQSITLDKDKIGQLPEGEADLWLERYYTTAPSQVTSASGLSVSKYRAVNAKIYFY